MFCALCLIGYVISEIVRSPGQRSTILDGWGVDGFEVLLALMCASRALVRRGGRLVALVLGAGLLMWAIGDIALTAEGSNPPSPSVADAFYLAFYPTTYLGLMLLIRRSASRFGLATWLDGAVAGLGAAALCAAFAFSQVAQAAGDTGAAAATNLAYPIGDVLLLLLVVGGTALVPAHRRGQWLLLATGYALNTVGDTFNLFSSGIGATHVGTAFNAVAWPTSILLVSASVWLLARPAEGLRYERPPGFALPGLATLVALGILLTASLTHLNRPAVALAGITLAVASVRVALSLIRLRSLTAERHAQAVTDQLTTLGNRRAMFELLDALLREHQLDSGDGREFAFLFVDLNHFKEVNDSFGHAVGDELLRQLGERLTGALRGSDLLVRLGGDEFGVALLDADADYGATVARRLSSTLEEPFQLGHVRAKIGASIGIAVAPTDATDAHDLLRCADLAMYRAKLDEKPFAIYQAEIDGRGNRLGLVEDLRGAIDRRELELHYQPQIELPSGRVTAVEALVRWTHPRLGFVPPLEFVPLAEDAGLMDLLTEAVLDGALEQCAAWRTEHEALTVAVNISTTNLLNEHFPALVRRLLANHGLRPQSLVLEITETTAMADVHRCKQAIQELRDIGLVVSVDDFGAGFTSLAFLSSLAVSELKLDSSFISGLATARDSRDVALVHSTIDLAHALGLRVVAEGVEDSTALDLLVELGCDLAQGYLIGRPKPAEEVSLAPYESAAFAA
jgi:diguanylate cyclase (GGDEF)-like protein